MKTRIARYLLALSALLAALGMFHVPAKAGLSISQAKAVLVGRLNDHAEYEYHRDLARILESKPMRVAEEKVHKEEWTLSGCTLRSVSAERNVYIDLSKIEEVTIQHGNRVHFGCPSGQRCIRVLERNPTRQRMVYGSYEVVPDKFRRDVIRAQAERIRKQCDPGGKA